VAQRVGVSVKTVSRAINNHPDVSAATRAAVQEVVRELGFQPNAAAQGLRKGRTGMLGLLIPDILNPHYAEYARQMQMIAHGAGYMLVVSNYDYDSALALTNLSSFVAHRVDGLIWMAGALNRPAREVIQAAKLPTVVIDETVPDDIPYVKAFISGDSRNRATYMAVSQLIELGHRRLAYLTEGPELRVAGNRLAAFRAALTDHGLLVDEGLIKSTTYLQTHKLEGGYRAVNELFDEGQRPTAICALTDLIAIGALRALHDRGLSVPGDVSVIGCDDILQSSYTDPPLTTIHTPYAQICNAVLKLVQHMIEPENRYEPVSGSTIEYTLIPRASTGVVPRR
jgi:DNA-binding LacI/PurR family transcriptional regulator